MGEVAEPDKEANRESIRDPNEESDQRDPAEWSRLQLAQGPKPDGKSIEKAIGPPMGKLWKPNC